MSTDKVIGNYSSLEGVDIQNLSIDKLKLLRKKYIDEMKNSYNKFAQKKKLIKDIKKLQKIREDINNGVDIKKKIKPKKIKTFDEYFQECIKNKTL